MTGPAMRRVLPLVVLLIGLGVGGAFFRSWSVGYPLVPHIRERLWEARLSVRWTEGQTPVSVLLPRDSAQQVVSEERLTAGPLEQSIAVHPGGNRRLQWTGSGAMAAAYQAEILLRASPQGITVRAADDPIHWLRADEFPPSAVAAARRLVAHVAARDRARYCFDVLTGLVPVPAGLDDEVAEVLLSSRAAAEAVVACWRAAELPSRVVQTIPVRAGLYRQMEFLAEVFDRSRWTLADADLRRFPAPDRWYLTWAWGASPLAQGRDGTPAEWELELVERRQTLWAQFFRHTANQTSFLTRWSLYALSPDMQEVFRVLLLVPVGALMVAFLRNVVGFATFGTFMPILIAITFRQTELLYGLVLFNLIVGAGYAVRVALDRYKLLLVPRLSAILTFVIGCLAALAVLGQHLGLRNILSVGLLPMVILTMTIERFFVLSEESGVRAALRMAAGTAGVAAITYGIISWEYLQLLFFTYPELLLVVAACQIALGRYVGFRLSELLRFRRLGGEA